jgi:NAD(P)-dependent dehydrogenase (short-subunit alcohol dehydrogenase family)
MTLRDGLLSGRAIVLAGGAGPQLREALIALGASIEEFAPGSVEDDSCSQWARDRAPLHALVYDAREPFGEGGQAALRTALEEGWTATRAVATGALIPAGGGKIVLLAPPPDAGPHAGAVRSGLENLARTLSVEWARYKVTTTMIAPGPSTTDEELGELVCFLCSPAGDYFSGCRLELGAVSP